MADEVAESRKAAAKKMEEAADAGEVGGRELVRTRSWFLKVAWGICAFVVRCG